MCSLNFVWCWAFLWVVSRLPVFTIADLLYRGPILCLPFFLPRSADTFFLLMLTFDSSLASRATIVSSALRGIPDPLCDHYTIELHLILAASINSSRVISPVLMVILLLSFQSCAEEHLITCYRWVSFEQVDK